MQDSSSYQTFRAVRDYLNQAVVDFFTLENVDMDSSTDDSTSNSNVIVQTLEQVGSGYFVKVFKLCSCDFGVPQRRVRLFFVGLNKETQDEKSFHRIEEWLKLFQLKTQTPDMTLALAMLHTWYVFLKFFIFLSFDFELWTVSQVLLHLSFSIYLFLSP